ncbi:geranylgeranyl reductase family protein [Corynebacterium glyciniphilum]|uniref:geranylgeranyl reductase family protein n=1 Tax=Corynebacterium glyciniphilum TaxID=1404244 RepID=UPI0011AB5235|nr:geranylgeranyl reductase family protein [Corynebacterium glyciniphilum]
MVAMNDTECEVLVVGAGPAGSAAAHRAAGAGRDVLLVDMQDFPRDKTCGDGLTPRAVHALERLGASDLVSTSAGRPEIRGLKLHGFGGSVTAPWPGHTEFPARGTAVARTDIDNALVNMAVASGARLRTGTKAVDVETDLAGGARRVRAVHFADGSTVRCRYLVLAEGVRSGIARTLGTRWLRGLVHGVAARSYCPTPFGDESWIHSHLELRDSEGTAQPGYGWIFPLGTDGEHGSAVNLGCGALSTSRRPAKVNVRRLLATYAEQCREEWSLGEPTQVASALLPMGGAVTRVAGVNWAAVGDTAALVNPLNGEGIDYALESAADVVDLLPDADRSPDGLRYMWPAHLSDRYGDAFSLARRAATLLTMPGLLAALGPLGMRGPLSDQLMGSAARLMGNLVTPEDRDLTARAWLTAGRLSSAHDRFWHAESRPLFGR